MDETQPDRREEPRPDETTAAPRGEREDRRGRVTSARTERGPPPAGDGLWSRIAAATLRLTIGLAGFVLVLYALGQAVGVDVLDAFADAVTSEPGRWLVIAAFGVLLIAVAARTSMTRV